MSLNRLKPEVAVFAMRRPNICRHCRFLKRASIVPLGEHHPKIVFTCTRKDCDNHCFVDAIPVKAFRIIEP